MSRNVIDDLLKDGAFSCDNYLADIGKETIGNTSSQKPASRWFIPYYIENSDFLDDFKKLIKDKSDLELMGLHNKKNITLMNLFWFNIFFGYKMFFRVILGDQ